MGRERLLRNDTGGGELFHIGTVVSSSSTRSVPVSSPPPVAVGVGVDGGANYILHTVSKYDTLAGVAIKYGVEVADIKRLNGLATDLQMYALKTIQIPLPGRHPPSPTLSNGHDTPPRPSSSQQTASSRRHSDLFDSFSSLKLKSSSEQKASPAIRSLQGYYGLGPDDQKCASAGSEMAYWKGAGRYLEDGPFLKSSPIANPTLNHSRKSKSASDCIASENGNLTDQNLLEEAESTDSAKWIEKLLRRCQKSEAGSTSSTPEKLLKEENTNCIAVSSITGKGLALRPKSASRSISGGVDGEAGGFNPIPIGLGDSSVSDGGNGVRKSSSTPSMQDTDNCTLSSIWPTSKWSDFQALSTASITRPMFDGLPRPSNRRNKAALD